MQRVEGKYLEPFGSPADYIVVGGGSAGCVLASRLSENPSVNVILLEAGSDYPQDVPNELTELYGGKAVLRSKYYWPDLKGATASENRYPGGDPPHVSYKQPMILGGGSSINGQLALRGAPDDFNVWEELGASGWRWDTVLPYFKKLERDLDFDDEFHGGDGPIAIHRVPFDEWDSGSIAVRDALIAEGYPLLLDMNGEFGVGHGPVPLSSDGVMRSSTVRTYLSPAVRQRRNLRIFPDTKVTRLVSEGRRVVGVEAIRDNERIIVPALRTVLSAGAIMTPIILQRSGIGDGDRLRRSGIDTVSHRPGVGRNLQNHPMTSLSAYTVPRSRGVAPTRRVFSYFRYSSGLEGCESEDMVVSIAARSMWHSIGSRMITVSPYVGVPYSRGSVELNQSDPNGNPVIRSNCLDDDRDLIRLREAFKFMANVMKTHMYPAIIDMPFPTHLSRRVERFGVPNRRNAWVTWAGAKLMDSSARVRSAIVNTLIREGPSLDEILDDDDRIDEFLSERVNLVWHHSCTARMGSEQDPGAVVNPTTMEVYGIEGVFVADASAMARMTRTNLNLPTIMLAERASDLIVRAG